MKTITIPANTLKEGDTVTTTNRIPLSEHLKTLGNREELIGLKVRLNRFSDMPMCIVKVRYNRVTARLTKGDTIKTVTHDMHRFSIDLSEQ